MTGIILAGFTVDKNESSVVRTWEAAKLYLVLRSFLLPSKCYINNTGLERIYCANYSIHGHMCPVNLCIFSWREANKNRAQTARAAWLIASTVTVSVHWSFPLCNVINVCKYECKTCLSMQTYTYKRVCVKFWNSSYERKVHWITILQTHRYIQNRYAVPI